MPPPWTLTLSSLGSPSCQAFKAFLRRSEIEYDAIHPPASSDRRKASCLATESADPIGHWPEHQRGLAIEVTYLNAVNDDAYRIAVVRIVAVGHQAGPPFARAIIHQATKSGGIERFTDHLDVQPAW